MKFNEKLAKCYRIFKIKINKKNQGKIEMACGPRWPSALRPLKKPKHA